MSGWSSWKTLHVHLDGEVPLLEAGQGAGGALVVFWHGGMPLGQRRFPASELPVSPERLWDIGVGEIAETVLHNLTLLQHAGPTETEVPGAATGMPGLREMAGWNTPMSRLQHRMALAVSQADALSASVVICTRDRPDALATCLDSVIPCLGTSDEVVVVDNAPATEQTRAVVSGHARARYVLEARPGLDIARNAGIRSSVGDVIVFCDDDVEVHPEWLRRIKTPFLHTDVVAATGLVLPASLETEAQYLFETFWGFNRGCRIRVFGPRYFASHRDAGVPAWDVGAGASMAFRRAVFRQLGGFDERLDVGAAGCSGDSEMWYRALAAGYLCWYEPSAVSFHHHRRDMTALRRQMFGYMRGHAAALLVQYERHRHAGNLRRLLLSMPWYYSGKIARRALGADRARLQTLADEIRGWISGVGFYLRQPRRSPPAVVDGGET